MDKRQIDTPIREAISCPTAWRSHCRMTLACLSELVIEVSFRCAPDATREPEVNQATILTFARDALTAQISAITNAHGSIPHELN